jgi:polyhydroxybutyrate depolymerase
MLHGSSGDGDKFYRISGWTEVSDSTGIIAVFPSSGRYCIEEDGKTKNTTKWNTYRSDWDFCNGEDGLDDQAFFRAIVDHLDDELNIDLNRVYLAGFSNGGIMTSQSAVELGDLFAACASNSGTFYAGETYNPGRPMPYMAQAGNAETFMRSLNNGDPFPLNRMEELLTEPLVRHVFDIPISIFGLSDQPTREGNVNQQACLIFPPLDPTSKVAFRFCLVNQLEHNYPNGRNHPFHAAWDQWQWMKQFRR